MTHGKGRLIHADSDVYDGEWQFDKGIKQLIFIKLMAKENTLILMEQHMKGIGQMINKKDTVQNNGLMVLNMKVNTYKV